LREGGGDKNQRCPKKKCEGVSDSGEARAHLLRHWKKRRGRKALSHQGTKKKPTMELIGGGAKKKKGGNIKPSPWGEKVLCASKSGEKEKPTTKKKEGRLSLTRRGGLKGMLLVQHGKKKTKCFAPFEKGGEKGKRYTSFELGPGRRKVTKVTRPKIYLKEEKKKKGTCR